MSLSRLLCIGVFALPGRSLSTRFLCLWLVALSLALSSRVAFPACNQESCSTSCCGGSGGVCCTSNQICCSNPNHCCGANDSCCGTTCCADNQICCSGQNRCCGENENCCGTNLCCTGPCCDSDGGGKHCCSAGEQCCGGGTYGCYDPSYEDCCDGKVRCNKLYLCCGSTCFSQYPKADYGCCPRDPPNSPQPYQKATACCYNQQVLALTDSDGNGSRDCCYLPTPTLDDLLACPGTKKQNLTVEHEYDGCSLPWWLELPLDGDKDNPCGSTSPDTSFYDCCGNPSGPQPSHDQRYQTCGFSKSTADTLMGTCMYNKCAAAGHPSCGLLGLVTCDEYASGYVYGLAEHGDAAYEERQLGYCLCCVVSQ